MQQMTWVVEKSVVVPQSLQRITAPGQRCTPQREKVAVRQRAAGVIPVVTVRVIATAAAAIGAHGELGQTQDAAGRQEPPGAGHHPALDNVQQLRRLASMKDDLPGNVIMSRPG